MRILIANDDGYNSPGIIALARIVGRHHEVYVCAPEEQRSAFSHSVLYFRKDLSVREVQMEGAVKAWAADGTPADCVYLAVCGLMEKAPDLVLSGINKGSNLSTDCLYSGTAGAAAEGMVLGFPAIAVSLAGHEPEEYDTAAHVAEEIMRVYMEDPGKEKYYLNINVPDLKREDIKGIRSTRLCGRRMYARKPEAYSRDGRLYLHIPMVRIPFEDRENAADGDVHLVEQGYVSVTPIMHDWTDHEKREEWKNMLEGI